MSGQPYKNYYTWETPLSEHVMGHNDGSVSCMINWQGYDCDMAGSAQVAEKFKHLYEVLKELNSVCEFHWWREKDTSLAEQYLKKSDEIKRGGRIAHEVRHLMAEHLSKASRSNQTAIVLHMRPPVTLKGSLFKKNHRNDQIGCAEKLMKKSDGLCRLLPGGRVATLAEYISKIEQSYWRRGYYNHLELKVDYRYDLSEQVLISRPKEVDGCVDIQDHKTKVLLMYMYPDASPGWFQALSDASCDMHVIQTIYPVDTRAYINKQTQETKDDQSSLVDKGIKYAKKKIREREAFTSHVADNNLEIYKNCYIIHLHGDGKNINRLAEKIEKWVSKHNGQVRADSDIQAHFFRAGQLAHGIQSNFFREDDTWQVANMAPVITYDGGIAGGESLRLSTTGQLTGFSILKHKVSHGFTVAQTGAGKGVDKGVEILESYPFGLDWYIAEAGMSYEWIVEGLGGTYVKYDPDKDVINPFPDYSLTDTQAANPVDVTLCSSTVAALSFLLLDGETGLTVHQKAAAEKALQQLYKEPINGKKAPRLDHYQAALESCAYENRDQKEAAEIMASNLYSFLKTAVGERFKSDTNLNIHEGLFGIDLKMVTKTDKKLMEFCLTSIGLRYSQLAFYKSGTPSRVLLDELHEFLAVSPQVISNLCRQISRMGRKDGASLDLVTQGLNEMITLDSEVIGSTTLRNLLYRNKDWVEMAQILKLPEPALQRWQGYPHPDALNWRPALRSVHGKFFDLHLTFPQFILDITSTDASDIEIKEQISAKTKDIFERQQMLQQMRLKTRGLL